MLILTVANSSTIYSVAPQCKRNPLLNFHSNNERLYIVNTPRQWQSKLTTVAFPLQQWLREDATM